MVVDEGENVVAASSLSSCSCSSSSNQLSKILSLRESEEGEAVSSFAMVVIWLLLLASFAALSSSFSRFNRRRSAESLKSHGVASSIVAALGFGFGSVLLVFDLFMADAMLWFFVLVRKRKRRRDDDCFDPVTRSLLHTNSFLFRWLCCSGFGGKKLFFLSLLINSFSATIKDEGTHTSRSSHFFVKQEQMVTG